MPSDRQLAANRANARKSTGPRTPEGKARSSQNALKTGLYAEGIVIGYELSSALEELIEQFTAEYCPTTPTERSLVDQLIHCEWMLRRFRWLETEVWKVAEKRETAEMRQISSAGYAYTDNPAISRLYRERRSIQRMYRETLAELRRFRPAPESPPQTTDPKTASRKNVFVPPNLVSTPKAPKAPSLTPAPAGPYAEISQSDVENERRS